MQQYFGPSNNLTKRSAVKSYGIVFLIFLAFFGGWLVARRGTSVGNVNESKDLQNVGLLSENYNADPDFQTFWDVWTDIRDNYVRQPIDETKLFYGAMSGMLRATEDSYSDFFDPELTKAFNEELSGSFNGIGVEIGRRNDAIVIITPLEGSPGEQAGLRPGDIVLTVDGKEIFGLSLEEVVSMIRGEIGTTVALTVISEADEQPREILVERQKIEHIGLRWEFLENDIAHINLSSFDKDSENLLNQFIREMQNRGGVDGIILDMRNNPGGFLDMSIEVASEWVNNGVVVKEKDNKGEERVHHSRGNPRLENIPTVILVNEGSASASEIVAGALQDFGLAQVVGKKTFGKGSVQKYEILPDGSSYRLTIALWYTPNDRQIEKDGIVPDFEVELTEEDINAGRDPQLDRALELLGK